MEYEVAWEKVKSADGVIVPGGFGNRYVFWFIRSSFVVVIIIMILIPRVFTQRISWEVFSCRVL